MHSSATRAWVFLSVSQVSDGSIWAVADTSHFSYKNTEQPGDKTARVGGDNAATEETFADNVNPSLENPTRVL